MIIGLGRVLVAVAAVVGMTACGGGSPSSTSGTAGLPGTSPGQVTAPTPVQRADEVSYPVAGFPGELVGVWGRTSNAGKFPSIEFAPGGAFRMGGFTGTAVVRGATMVMTIDGQAPTTADWSLRGGVLELGGVVYLRDDRGAATPSIVGYWINDNGWTSIRFAGDGQFQLDDQANAETTVGTYSLDRNRLVLTPRTKRVSTYLIQLDDGLSFADANGVPVAHYTRAG